MTEETENQLLQDIGALKANIETYHNDTKRALNLITGNGRPQDGILYIMTDLRRLHEKCPVITGELPERVAKLETQGAVNKATENVFVKVWAWIKTHPKISISTGIAILGALGFSVDKAINFLNLIKDIATKVGL